MNSIKFTGRASVNIGFLNRNDAEAASSIILVIAPVFAALTASGLSIVNVLFPAIIVICRLVDYW